MENEKKNSLINRIENNFINFQSSLYGVSREKLIGMSGRIAAVTEAYEILTNGYCWDEEYEIDFYLLFRDPLTIIADAWENSRIKMRADFDCALFDVSYSDNIISEYPLMDGADIRLCGGVTSFNG